jgi:uncharacterized protein YuzE
MKITYDPDGDMMYIELNDHYPFNTDTTTVPGLAIIYDEAGKVCAIEIEDASEVVNAPNRVDFECFTVEEAQTTDQRESA